MVVEFLKVRVIPTASTPALSSSLSGIIPHAAIVSGSLLKGKICAPITYGAIVHIAPPPRLSAYIESDGYGPTSSPSCATFPVASIPQRNTSFDDDLYAADGVIPI